MNYLKGKRCGGTVVEISLNGEDRVLKSWLRQNRRDSAILPAAGEIVMSSFVSLYVSHPKEPSIKGHDH